MELKGEFAFLVILIVYVSGFRTCPEKCKEMKNTTLPSCNKFTGDCSMGCVSGFFGNTCETTCDVNCEETCQQHDGSCKCLPGYTFNAGVCESHTGVKCTSNDNCLNDRCSTAGREDCLEGCKPGWFGKFCEDSCASNCFCEQESGNCTSCEEGWYGQECESLCSRECLNKICHKLGTCVGGCSTGSYGKRCELTCSPYCVSGCDQLTGDCVQCVAGRYGSTCQSECSVGCAGFNRDCDRDGYCIRGCRNGFFGDTCRSACPEQCYEDRCDMEGTCSNCKLGFYGTFCHQTCHRCTENICELITGNCIKGCEGGFFGSSCNQTCENCDDGVCDMATGECQNKGIQYWVGGGVAVVIITIAAVLVYISYRFKRMHGVMYDVVKWRRRAPSVIQDANPVVSPGYVELDDETRRTPPMLCPISPPNPINSIRPLSYIHPRHSGSFANDLHIQPDRPDSYCVPNYCELNEDLMVPPIQARQGAEASGSSLSNSSFILVAEVHKEFEPPGKMVATGDEISIPLIADCFWNKETQDPPPEEEPRPEEENYNHLFRDHYVP